MELLRSASSSETYLSQTLEKNNISPSIFVSFEGTKSLLEKPTIWLRRSRVYEDALDELTSESRFSAAGVTKD